MLSQSADSSENNVNRKRDGIVVTHFVELPLILNCNHLGFPCQHKLWGSVLPLFWINTLTTIPHSSLQFDNWLWELRDLHPKGLSFEPILHTIFSMMWKKCHLFAKRMCNSKGDRQPHSPLLVLIYHLISCNDCTCTVPHNTSSLSRYLWSECI